MTNVYIYDIDGVLLNPGNYFKKHPFPKNGKRGDKKYDAWLRDAEQYLNKHGTSNPGMVDFVNTLQLVGETVYYLTSKQEYLRTSTVRWLEAHGFPTEFVPLLMRPKGDLRSYGAFKIDVLKNLEKALKTVGEEVNIIMFDDDPKRLLEKQFKKHKNWTLFKAVTGGVLP